MGYDLLAGLLFVALTPLVVLAFVVTWIMTHDRRSEVEEIWERYATSRALRFVAAEGEWPNRTNPSILWETDGLLFRLVLRGREAHVATRIEVRPRGTILGTAVISPSDGVTFRTFEKPEGTARRLFGDEARKALLAFWQGDDVSVTYRRGLLVVAWAGGETNDARLDEARQVAARIASSVEDGFERAAA